MKEEIKLAPTPREEALALLGRYKKYTEYWDCRNDEPLDVGYEIDCAIIDVNNTLQVLDIHQWQNRILLEHYNEVLEELNKMKYGD